MDVKFRGGGFPRKFAEALNEFFLELVVNVVLLAEEDNTPLGN